MKFCLASVSPQRIAIMGRLGLDFFSVDPEVEELGFSSPYFSQTAFENSRRKAFSVSQRQPGIPVIGADTVIESDHTAIGKPRSIEDAVEMLMSFSGRTHTVLTAVSIMIDGGESLNCVFGDVTEVRMKNFKVETAREYAGRVNVLDKAGAYAIQQCGDMIVASIRGSFSNVVGLPMEKLSRALHHLFGVRAVLDSEECIPASVIRRH